MRSSSLFQLLSSGLFDSGLLFFSISPSVVCVCYNIYICTANLISRIYGVIIFVQWNQIFGFVVSGFGAFCGHFLFLILSYYHNWRKEILVNGICLHEHSIHGYHHQLWRHKKYLKYFSPLLIAKVTFFQPPLLGKSTRSGVALLHELTMELKGVLFQEIIYLLHMLHPSLITVVLHFVCSNVQSSCKSYILQVFL
jgi:hypothetical protein